MVNFSSSSISSFTSLIQKNLITILNETVQRSSQFCDLNANVKIIAKGDITITGNVTASAKGYCNMKAVFSVDNKVDLQAEINSVITKSISQDSEQSSGFGSFLQLNSNMSKQDSQNYIQNIISKSITTSTIQEALQRATVSANLELEASGNITITGNVGSEVQAQIVADFFSNSIGSLLSKDAIVQKIDETFEQKNKQKEETLSSIFFYIVIAVVIGLFGIFLLPQLLSGGSSDPAPKNEVYPSSRTSQDARV